ncbi:MAG: hypothetical protein J0H15_01640 [Xanthomonadales bacterium]|nr:hypothetical protein [Xanthomonadales bacterium]
MSRLGKGAPGGAVGIMPMLSLLLLWPAMQSRAQELVWDRAILGEQPSVAKIARRPFEPARVAVQADRMAVPVWRNFSEREQASVVMYEADATLAWRRDMPPPCNHSISHSPGVAVAFASDGDVFVAVATEAYYSGGAYPAFACVARLEAGSGQVRWIQVFTPDDPLRGVRALVGLSVDRNDDVVAVGSTREPQGREDGWVVKLSGIDGTPLWSYRDVASASFGSSAWATDVAVAEDGAAFVVVRRRDDMGLPGITSSGVRLLKLSADGALLWQQHRDAGSLADPALALALRGDDTLLWAWAGREARLELLRAENGVPLWQRGMRPERARVVLAAPPADIFVGGYDVERTPGERGEVLARISPADGSDLWSVPVDDPAPNPSWADVLQVSQLATSLDGDVLVEAVDTRAFADSGVTPFRSIVSFSRIDGSKRWRRDLTGSSVMDRASFLRAPEDHWGRGVLGVLDCWDPWWDFSPCGIRLDRFDLQTGASAGTTVDPQLAEANVRAVQGLHRFNTWNPRHDWAWLAGSDPGPVLLGASGYSQLNAMRASAANGGNAWTAGRRDTFGGMLPMEIALAAGADVVVLGADTEHQFLTRLSGATGEAMWRTVNEPLGSPGEQHLATISTDPRGNVLHAWVASDNDIHVASHDGPSGVRRWHRRFPGAGSFVRIATDGAGNALVAAMGASGGSATLNKLNGSDGSVAWVREFHGSDVAIGAMAVAPDGDVLLLGDREQVADRHVLFAERLRAGDGAVAWSRNALEGSSPRAYASAAVLAGGRFLVGAAGGGCWGVECGRASSWVVASLDPADGDVHWLRNVAPGDTMGRVSALGTAQGMVLVGGSCKEENPCAAGLSPVDGSTSWMIGPTGAPSVLSDARGYPSLLVMTGSGELLIGASLGFPGPGADIEGWHLVKMRVPVPEAIFASGFQ